MQRPWSEPPEGSGRPWVECRVQLDGTELAAWHRGGRGPAVVLEAGLGLPGWFWQDVCDRLPPDAAVLRYDRAGLGDSRPGTRPRSAARQARELADLLDLLELPTPYVLVGHSAGALVVRLLALERPDQVAALVLVDPSVEDQPTHRGLDRAAEAALGVLALLARAPAVQRAVGAAVAAAAPRVGRRLERRLRLVPALFRPGHLEGTRRENEAFEQSLAQVRRATAESTAATPSTSVIVPASAGSGPLAGRRPGRRARGIETPAGGGHGRRIVAERSGHLVPLDAPQLVASVIASSCT